MRDDRTGGVAVSWFVDAVVALVVVAAFWVPSVPRGAAGAPVAVVACVVVGAAVLLRWRWPTAATVTAAAATAVGWAAGASTDPMTAAAWCLYPLALRAGGGARRAGRLAGGVVAAAGVLAATSAGSLLVQRVLLSGIALGVAWLLGRAEARRAEAVRLAADRAAQVERMRTQATTAREVHDVVGHALTFIRAEADVARNLPGTHEQELRASLADIEQRAREALEEVQAFVRQLRAGVADAGATTTADPAQALPGLLVAARAGGLGVTSRLDLPALDAATGHVVVRVVQEALSNVVRHAAASGCEVVVRERHDVLEVRVDDDGRGPSGAPSWGAGLTGMRERVTAVGGELTVGRRPGGGTRVDARIPLEGRR